MDVEAEALGVADYKDAAEMAGLTYASINEPGIERRRAGKGFSYRDSKKRKVTDATLLNRIRRLAIPPAWRSVWICPDPNGHIQAFGYDDKGRKQYRYHPKFREVRESIKFEHMRAFAEALPCLRRRVAEDMARPGLGRAKVLATVVHLLETTMIRIGNDSYAKENDSFGLTTLRARHVTVESSQLKFHFKGKGGKPWRLGIRDRRVIKIVKSCQELPGQHLFQYADDDGTPQTVTSSDVNAYLKEVTGAAITAKDFRTWSGTVLAAEALMEFETADSGARTKKNVTRAIEQVAARLGNTPAICRKCYIHPEVVNAYLNGGLLREVESRIGQRLREDLDKLRPEEAAVLAFLRERVARDLASAKGAGEGKAPSITNGVEVRKRRPKQSVREAKTQKSVSPGRPDRRLSEPKAASNSPRNRERRS
jgi:DNA topoisomerase I